MALTAGNIITDRVRVLLRDIDDGGIQWLDAELLSWYNEGCGEVARIRPEAHSATVTKALDSGALQRIPDGGSHLLEVVCNMANDVEGRSVLRIDRRKLDAENRYWMTDTPKPEVYRYSASLTDPKTFYVYPPSDGNPQAKVRLVYSTPPAQATGLTSPFSLPEKYAAVVANYILYRAFAKMTDSADMQSRAAGYLQLFESQLNVADSTMEGRNAVTRDPSAPTQYV